MIDKPRHESNQGWMRFDPRARILALLFFVVAVCAVSSPAVLAELLVLALFLAAASGMPPGHLWKRLLPVNVFMLLAWLTMPFLAEGPYRSFFERVDVSVPGLHQALIITLKANAIVAAAAAILYATETGALAVALRHLGMPAKLVWMLLLTHRYVLGLADRVGKSRLAIGMRSGKNGVMRFRAYGGLFAKLFVGGHESGDRLYRAMRLRGYGDGLALRRELRWRRRDSAFAGGMVVLSGLAIWIGGIA